MKKLLEGSRVLPQALDIEKQVLGAMLVEASCIKFITKILEPMDFHAEYHQKIFAVIVDMYERNLGIDIITVANELSNRKELESIGGETYLAGLTMTVTSARNVVTHARIVFEHSLRRQLILILQARLPLAYDPEDTFNFIDETCDLVVGLRARKNALSESDTTDQLEEFLEYRDKLNRGDMVRVPSHLPALNKISKGGIRQGSYVFVGGEPGSGKTTFLLQMAHAGAISGVQTEFIEGEMTSNELYERLIGITTRRDIDVGMQDQKLVVEFANEMFKLPLRINTNVFPRSFKTLEGAVIRAILRGAKKIYVDYLQVFARKDTDEFSNIKAISEMLREKALQYGVTIIVGSSLVRGKDKSGMDRFYGGAQLMHDCSVAILLEGEQRDDEISTGERKVMMKVPKNRGGARTGEDGIALRYDLRAQRFTEYYDENESPRQTQIFEKAEEVF